MRQPDTPSPPLPRNDDPALGPPLCLTCGYILLELPGPRCPECGRPFDPRRPETFSYKPPFLRWRYWFPGLALASIGGLTIALGFLIAGDVGWGLSIGVPFAVGGILGYGVRARLAVRILLGMGAVVIVGTALIAMHPAGLICGLILTTLFMLPVIIGAVFGAMLRATLKRSDFQQRAHLPIFLLFLLIPSGLDSLQRRYGDPPATESIRTEAILTEPADCAWHDLMFYEEVRHEPTLLLRLGLPRPLRTTGRADRVGEVKVCIYERGVLRKLVAQCEPGRLLAFDVIEQEHVQDHAIRLLRGSFRFEPLGAYAARVTLTTEYEPLMTPRWYWRGAEQLCGHTLHAHVLEGMRLRALDSSGAVGRQVAEGP